MNPPSIGAQLLTVRTERLLTMEALSKKSGVAVGTISELERDKADPRISTITKLAKAMGGKVRLKF